LSPSPSFSKTSCSSTITMSVSSSPRHPCTSGSSELDEEPGPAAVPQLKPHKIGLETSCCFSAPLPEYPPTLELEQGLADGEVGRLVSVGCMCRKCLGCAELVVGWDCLQRHSSVEHLLEQLSGELPAISKREPVHLPAEEPSPPPLARYDKPATTYHRETYRDAQFGTAA